LKPYKTVDANRGFTLVEVLVALAIVSISIMTIFQMFSSGLWQMKRAGVVAHQVLVEKQVVSDISLLDLESINIGKERIEGVDVSWKVKLLEKAKSGLGVVAMYQVAVSMEFDAGKTKNLSLTQIRVSQKR